MSATKACYFCGNPKTVCRYVHGTFQAMAVCCCDCGARGPAVENVSFDNGCVTNMTREEMEAQAIKEWNTTRGMK